MTGGQQAGYVFDSWLKATDPTPPDAGQIAESLVAEVMHTPQRGRWWPLPRLQRRTMPAVSNGGPAPVIVPAPNGLAPARESSVSPVLGWIVTVVVMVMVLGGILLTEVMTSRPGGDPVPAAVLGLPSPGAAVVSPSPPASADPMEAPVASPTPQPSGAPPEAAVVSPSPPAPGNPPEAAALAVDMDIIPGLTLTVQEAEPSVYRAISDGVRDVASFRNEDIVVGLDGGIWVSRSNRFFRLGSDDTRKWPARFKLADRTFEITADGAAWALRKGVLRRSDSEGWTTPPRPTRSVVDIDVAPDGTVWTMWEAEDGVAVGQLGPRGWESLEGLSGASAPARLFVTDANDVWLQAGGPTSEVLHHYANGAWQPLGPPARAVDVGEDGTVWFARREPGSTPGGETAADSVEDPVEGTLGRYDGSEWEWLQPGDGPAADADLDLDGDAEVAPDGSLWAGLLGAVDSEAVCDGVARFDGDRLDRYLQGYCMRAIDIGADGAVWLLASQEESAGSLVDLYVITPAAVSARR